MLMEHIFFWYQPFSCFSYHVSHLVHNIQIQKLIFVMVDDLWMYGYAFFIYNINYRTSKFVPNAHMFRSKYIMCRVQKTVRRDKLWRNMFKWRQNLLLQKKSSTIILWSPWPFSIIIFGNIILDLLKHIIFIAWKGKESAK